MAIVAREIQSSNVNIYLLPTLVEAGVNGSNWGHHLRDLLPNVHSDGAGQDTSPLFRGSFDENQFEFTILLKHFADDQPKILEWLIGEGKNKVKSSYIYIYIFVSPSMRCFEKMVEVNSVKVVKKRLIFFLVRSALAGMRIKMKILKIEAAGHVRPSRSRRAAAVAVEWTK